MLKTTYGHTLIGDHVQWNKTGVSNLGGHHRHKNNSVQLDFLNQQETQAPVPHKDNRGEFKIGECQQVLTNASGSQRPYLVILGGQFVHPAKIVRYYKSR